MKPLQSTAENQNASHSQKVIKILQDAGVMDAEAEALFARFQRSLRGRTLSEILVDAGVDESETQMAIASVANITFQLFEESDVAIDIVDQIGITWCKEHGVLPVRLEGKMFMASSSLEAFFLADDLAVIIGSKYEQLLTTSRSITNAIESIEGETVGLDFQEFDEEDALFFEDECEESSIDLEAATADADSSPVVRLVSSLIATAVRESASDIHVEPSAEYTKTRFRIDGVLHDLMQSPNKLHSAVVSRIKILANLDIAERRIPQDGRIRANILGRPIDLRVSTVPTPKGEKVVLRILDDRNIRIGLDDLGFQKETLEKWQHEIENPHGIILVTGPTGCGKTTTLYASLQQMDRKRLNISTVEDPVEYELSGITQIQVHEQIDMTFSRALRALLRQDPDVVLVGEIRDMETASVAIQAAMTGHLVLSTLHTNDAPSSLTRLINIGIEPFLVASAVNAVLAQRLARRVCSKCVEMKKPTVQEKELLEDFDVKKIPYAVGCSACRGSGYSGRLGLYELLLMDDELRDLIASNPTITAFRNLANERGMCNLQIDGFAKVAQGLTTFDEIYRLTQ